MLRDYAFQLLIATLGQKALSILEGLGVAKAGNTCTLDKTAKAPLAILQRYNSKIGAVHS